MSKRNRRVGPDVPAEDATRELEFHVQMKTDELVAEGWERAKARQEAERRFGDLDRVRAECAAIDDRHRRVERTRSAVSSVFRDLRHGVRLLRQRPGFSLVAILTLALGVGANTAIFSVVDAVLLRPLPYAASDRLVAVWESHPQRTARNLVTPGNFMDWRDGARSMEQMAAYRNDVSVALTGDGNPMEVTFSQVSANLFELLGVKPVVGRLFDVGSGPLPAGVPGAVSGSPIEDAVLMSHALWRSRFGADPGIVGRTIELDGSSYEVIGVLPPDVAVPSGETDIWGQLPLTEGARQQRRSHMYAVIGRLAPGSTVVGAQSEMTLLAARIAEAHPENMEGWTAHVTSLHGDMVRDARAPLLVLLGAVAVVLLIAGANVSNLLLVRGIGREREVAVRAALGAGRGGLIRQFLAESLVLAACGGIVAILIAWPTVRLLVAMAPAEIPLIEGARINGAVLGFSMLIVLATTLLFGTLPALRASRPKIERVLADSRSRGASRRQGRIRRMLVIGEVALSMLLVAAAALLLRSMAKLQATDSGFVTDNVLVTALYPSIQKYDTRDRQLAFYDALIDRVRQLPGVVSVAGTAEPPIFGYEMTFSVRIEDRPDAFAGDRTDYSVRAVTPGWFETSGIRLRSGRTFDSRDRADGNPVVIVNEAMAGQVWPGQDAVGRRLNVSDDGPWAEIVGIVADTRHSDLESKEGPAVYMPYSQKSWTWMSWMTLFVRTNGEPAELVPAVQRAVWALDPDLPIQRAVTFESLYADSLASRRFITTLIGIFAALALVLGIIGLYGVIAFGVAERTREIGVRIALGARPPRVVASVVAEGARLAAAGVALGLIGAALMRGSIRGLLFDTRSFDPMAIGLAALALIVCATAACLIPAMRAVRIEPASTLRSD